MPINTYVTFQDDALINVDPGGGIQLLDVLGNQDQVVAIQLRDMLSSIRDAIQGAIDYEGELNIEITGALELKGTGSVQYLLFNVGGSTTKTNTMKVGLKTKIQPK